VLKLAKDAKANWRQYYLESITSLKITSTFCEPRFKESIMPSIKSKDGTMLNVKVWGEGKPVVLIHGWPLSSATWDSIALYLAERGFQTISYDRRGFGHSDHAWHGHDYDTLADDLHVVVEAFANEQFSLVGFSMGGGEVVRYLTRHRGKRVNSIVLISSIVPYLCKTGDNPEGVDPATFEEMKRDIREDRAAFFEEFFPTFYGQQLLAHAVSSAVVNWSCHLAMQAGLKSTLDCIDAFSRTDFRPELKTIDCPTLLIHGTNDQVVPIDVSSRQAATMIRHAILHEIAEGGHGLLASHTDAICTDVLKFLQGKT